MSDPANTEFRCPSHISGLNRTASLSAEDSTESLSVSGSNSQLNNQFTIPLPTYTPDFYVRALTDLQFVKISQAQYQNGVMSSRLDSIPQSPDFGQPRLEGTTSPVLTTTPGKLSSGTPNPTPTPETTSPLADETTSLLNEEDCLHHNLSESSI